MQVQLRQQSEEMNPLKRKIQAYGKEIGMQQLLNFNSKHIAKEKDLQK
jgi:hypothetical protein